MAQRQYFYIGSVGDIGAGNDARDALQVVRVVGDDQRVIAGVDVDGVVGADQRAQHRHQIAGVFVVELEDLRDDATAAMIAAAHGHFIGLQFGIGFGDDLEQTCRLHHRKALHAQRGQILLVGRGR